MNAALRFVLSEPWAMTADAVRILATVARREGEGPEAVAARLGRPLDNTHKVTHRDGVAVLPVRGPIARYANLFSQISGATSIEKLATDLQASIDSPSVKAVLVDIDSPGGQANGIAEMAALIRECRKIKPVTAYISGTGASAAYWLASAADEVVVSPTAVVGSIGCIMAVDAEDDDGEMKFVSSQSPKKDPDPKTQVGREEIQAMVDALAQVFIDDVGRHRGLKPEEVVSKFGEGGVKIGQAAVDAGMADRVGTFEACLASLSKGRPSTSKAGSSSTAAPPRKVSMSLFERIGAWLAMNKPAEFAAVAQATADEEPATISLDAATLAKLGLTAGPKLHQPPVDIEAEIERRTALKLRETLEATFRREAKAFAASAVKAERIFPAATATVEALYVAFALEDRDHPLAVAGFNAQGVKAEVPVSRLDFLTQSIEAKPQHGLTRERVVEDLDQLPPGVKVFPNTHAESPRNGGSKRSNPSEVARLLAMTDEGQAALKDLAIAARK